MADSQILVLDSILSAIVMWTLVTVVLSVLLAYGFITGSLMLIVAVALGMQVLNGLSLRAVYLLAKRFSAEDKPSEKPVQ